MIAQREMSVLELNKSVENIKQMAEAQRGHVFIYEIWYLNPLVSPNEMQAGSGSSGSPKDVNVVDQFLRDFDAVLAMGDDVAYIRILMKNKKGVIAEPVLSLKSSYAPKNKQPQQPDNTKVMGVNPDQPLKNSALGVNAMLNLMGFGELAGTDDGTGGLNTVLGVRDKLRDEQREKKEMQDKIESLIAEKTNLQRDLDDANRQLDEWKKKDEATSGQLDGVNDELESLKEQLEEAQAETEKSKSIGGLIGSALLSIAKQKAPQLSAKLPMLSGVFDALATDDEPAAQQTEPAADEPRASQFKEFMAYARTLDNTDFGKLWKVICTCAQNKGAIDIMLTAVKPAGNDVEPEDDDEN